MNIQAQSVKPIRLPFLRLFNREVVHRFTLVVSSDLHGRNPLRENEGTDLVGSSWILLLPEPASWDRATSVVHYVLCTSFHPNYSSTPAAAANHLRMNALTLEGRIDLPIKLFSFVQNSCTAVETHAFHIGRKGSLGSRESVCDHACRRDSLFDARSLGCAGAKFSGTRPSW